MLTSIAFQLPGKHAPAAAPRCNLSPYSLASSHSVMVQRN